MNESWKRVKCPQCGNENPRKLHEEADKKSVLYYSIGKAISAYRRSRALQFMQKT